MFSLVCCFAYEFSVIKAAKLRWIKKIKLKWLPYWLHLKKKVFHPITVIMLTSESVVVLTGLDQKSWVCYVWDEDGTESKCVRFKDETQTFKCSRDQDQSRVLQHYFLYNTCLITTFCLYIRVFLHSNIHIGISPKNPTLVQPYLCTIKNHKYCLTKPPDRSTAVITVLNFSSGAAELSECLWVRERGERAAAQPAGDKRCLMETK